MRNLKNYLDDAQSIIDIYTNPKLSETKHPGNYFFFRAHLLSMYLKVRRYERKELVLIKQILSSQVDYDSPDTSHKELVQEIVSDINELSGPNTDFVQKSIDDNFIANPTKFQLAEIWAFDQGFVDEDSKWQDKKGYLGAFLNILIDKGVVHDYSSTRSKDQIDSYFADRYNVGLLKTLLKKEGKASKHYHLFDGLEEKLDAKAE